MLDVESIVKHFGQKRALDHLTFSIKEAEIVGLVGPNGSGKTTLLNILTGMIRPDSGRFHISNGVRSGMAVSRNGFFNDMTAQKNIMLYARLERVNSKRVTDLMNEFSIDFGSVRFGELSAGMKQRISLIIPFLADNHLIFLDEPSNHLDIDSILTLRDKILELKTDGVSFLITSHNFTDLEKVCDRILILREGKLITDRSTDMLIQEFGSLEEAYLQTKN